MRYCVHSALNLNLSNTELTLFCVMIVVMLFRRGWTTLKRDHHKKAPQAKFFDDFECCMNEFELKTCISKGFEAGFCQSAAKSVLPNLKNVQDGTHMWRTHM